MPASVKEVSLCGNQTASSFFCVPVLPLTHSPKSSALALPGLRSGCSVIRALDAPKPCQGNNAVLRVMVHSPDNAINKGVRTAFVQPLYL